MKSIGSTIWGKPNVYGKAETMATKQLPAPDCPPPIKMHDAEFEEIALQLGITPKAARNHYYRAMRKIRKLPNAVAELQDLVCFQLTGGWL